MPRYFFFLESQTESIADEEGEVLRDDAAAHATAAQTARELSDWDKWQHGTVVVRDEGGRFVSEVPIKPVAEN
jgi:hypothetical protein